jgi:hypothetical protein
LQSDETRIALFLPSLHGGGLERTMVSLANAFAAKGFAVDLVVVDATGPHRTRIRRPVNVVDLRRRLLSCLPALAGYLRRALPHVMLSTPNQANIIAIVARTMAGVETRLVVREASTLSLAARNARNRRGHLRPLCTRLCYRMADGVVAISEGVADDLAACAGVDRARISVIYNGIDVPEVLRAAAEPVEHTWLQPGGHAGTATFEVRASGVAIPRRRPAYRRRPDLPRPGRARAPGSRRAGLELDVRLA